MSRIIFTYIMWHICQSVSALRFVKCTSPFTMETFIEKPQVVFAGFSFLFGCWNEITDIYKNRVDKHSCTNIFVKFCFKLKKK